MTQGKVGPGAGLAQEPTRWLGLHEFYLSSQARIWMWMNCGVLCDGAGPLLELRLQGQASAVLSASVLFLALHPNRCKEVGG